ncbi:MAG: dihydropteroate synthase [Oligoflexales bacterium]
MTFRILGILNITPDSFSDGGFYTSQDTAKARADELLEQGADWIDIGAESTRPGSKALSTEEEWGRLQPVLATLSTASISIDTANPIIMKRALDYGVGMINCTNGTVDTETLTTLAKHGTHYIAMHRHGCSATMQQKPLSGSAVLNSIELFYAKSWKNLHSAGFSPGKIWLDPGYGFGKDISAQTHLMAATKKHSSQYQIVTGISRKSWLGHVLNIEDPIKRDSSSRMLEIGLVFAGTQMIRAHDVKVLNNIRSMLKTSL